MKEQASPPVRVSLKGQPTTMNYWLIPRHKPALSESIKDVCWEAVDKTLLLFVEETSSLDVYSWMEYMRERKKQAQEGPFINLDEDALMLKMYDGGWNFLGGFKFVNLTLIKHQCHLSKMDHGYGTVSALAHRLTIQYEEVKVVDLPEEPKNAQEAVDEEWQTV